MAVSQTSPMTWLTKLSVALLLFIVFLQPFLAMQNFSPVFDEVTHLPSGFSYLKTHQIKLNPQHPPLIKMLAAIPLLFLHPKFDGQDPNLIGDKPNEWKFGNTFLFSNNADRLLFWGRIPMILISVLLAWYVFLWAYELFGSSAGLVALFLYTFMPNLLAHAQFVATDLPLAAFAFITMYYFWKFSRTLGKNIWYIPASAWAWPWGQNFRRYFSCPLLLPWE